MNFWRMKTFQVFLSHCDLVAKVAPHVVVVWPYVVGGLHRERKGHSRRAGKSGPVKARLRCWCWVVFRGLVCLLTASVSLVTGSRQSPAHLTVPRLLRSRVFTFPQLMAHVVNFAWLRSGNPAAPVYDDIIRTDTHFRVSKKKHVYMLLFLKLWIWVNFCCWDFSVLLMWCKGLMLFCSWSCSYRGCHQSTGANLSSFASSMWYQPWSCAPGRAATWTCINS